MKTITINIICDICQNKQEFLETIKDVPEDCIFKHSIIIDPVSFQPMMPYSVKRGNFLQHYAVVLQHTNEFKND